MAIHTCSGPLPELGTLNPIEFEAHFRCPRRTGSLPVAVRLVTLPWPKSFHLELQQLRHPNQDLAVVAPLEEVARFQQEIKKVYVSPTIKRYLVELVRATRESSDLYLGSSPRGSLALSRAGQARAAMDGRDFVLPDDIKNLAEFVLAHRIIVDPAARLRNISAGQILQEILRTLPVPSSGFDDREGSL